MLKRMGFHEKWILWIKSCLLSRLASMLVNGSPTHEFGLHRGFCQGEPLVPFIFTIVGEGLTGMMREVTRKNLFKGFQVGNDLVEVNLLQYADDTIIMGEISLNNVLVIKAMLRNFELISMLKVNFFKTRIGGIGVGDEVLERFSDILNCRIMSFLFTYLGVLIGENPRCEKT